MLRWHKQIVWVMLRSNSCSKFAMIVSIILELPSSFSEKPTNTGGT